MSIEAQFNAIAQEYDANRKRFIPCFDDYYQGTTTFLAANLPAPKRVLDLGAGTGLLTSFWYRHFPGAAYVLVDIADEMLNVARKRFAGLDNVSYQTLDYAKALPSGGFDLIVSALSIHHLEDGEKRSLFQRIYDTLPPGGLFVNYDQFCAGQEEMNDWYDSYWEGQLASRGLTLQDLDAWKERMKFDRECSVAQEMEMLSTCRFPTVQCVYACQKFAVIVGKK